MSDDIAAAPSAEDVGDDGETFAFSFGPQGPAMVPYFGYRDAGAMIAFLTDVFGFETLARYEGPDGRVMHAEMNHGSGILMLGSVEDGAPDPSPRSGTYLVVDDVEAHHDAALEAGLEERGGAIVYGPQDTEFGTRRYRALDPEGFEWSFGTYRPALTTG